MEIKKIKSLYDKLLKDEDFDKLDLGLKNPNIFQILRISKNEIRHSTTGHSSIGLFNKQSSPNTVKSKYSSGNRPRIACIGFDVAFLSMAQMPRLIFLSDRLLGINTDLNVSILR